MRTEAEVEQPAAVLGPDDQLVAVDLNGRPVEQFLSASRRNARIAARAHGHVIRARDLDLLEVADLIVAGDCWSATFLAGVAAAEGGPCDGERSSGDGPAHDDHLQLF